MIDIDVEESLLTLLIQGVVLSSDYLNDSVVHFLQVHVEKVNVVDGK